MTGSLGGGCTTTGNVQLAVRARASAVVHVTVVVPITKLDPLTGVQLVVSGACPPVTVGAGNETTCAEPSSESTGSGATGQAIAGASLVGVGAVLLPPHAAMPAHTPTAVNQRERLKIMR